MSFSLNITELFHGDFGVFKDNDILIYVTNSGNTEEILNCANYIKDNFKVIQIALTIKKECKLSKIVDFHFCITDENFNLHEIDEINMSPTTSSLMFMSLLDTIGINFIEGIII
jgi:arabinose-5-phosphate isomerase